MRTESSSGFLGAVSSVLGEGHECVALARGRAKLILPYLLPGLARRQRIY